MDKERLSEIEQCLQYTTQGSWRFPGWKEELLDGDNYGELRRHCWIPELDELGGTGIQHSNDMVDWHDWDFIIRSHDEFVPELLKEIRLLREVVSDLMDEVAYLKSEQLN